MFVGLKYRLCNQYPEQEFWCVEIIDDELEEPLILYFPKNDNDHFYNKLYNLYAKMNFSECKIGSNFAILSIFLSKKYIKNINEFLELQDEKCKSFQN